MEFEEEPDYEYIMTSMMQCCVDCKLDVMDGEFDWIQRRIDIDKEDIEMKKELEKRIKERREAEILAAEERLAAKSGKKSRKSSASPSTSEKGDANKLTSKISGLFGAMKMTQE